MQTTNIRTAARRYFQGIRASLDGVSVEKLESIARIFYAAYCRQSKIILMGNGGSAAAASHAVCDLGKGTVLAGRRRLKVLALTDNVPLVTAYANDCGYEVIFAEQLKSICEKGDVVVAISGSGNSKNVLNGVRAARALKAVTVGLTGFKGGALKGLVSECLIVPDNCMERIEDMHLILLHAIKLTLMGLIKRYGDVP